MNRNQLTIKRSGKISGYGLHTGKKINLKLIPSIENKGIIFRRTDLKNFVEIPAVLANISNFKMSTNISKNNVNIKTVEHILSAINFLEIDNIFVEVDSEEIPIVDGSVYPFIYLLKFCGLKILNAKKKILKIKKVFTTNLNERIIIAIPNNKFIIKIYNNKNLKSKKIFRFDYNKNNYKKFLSKSRTFGFYEQYNYLKFNKLSNGIKLNNLLIFNKTKLLNSNVLRYKNETLKHKILDFIGDITLIKYKIIGCFLCFNINHELNNMFLNRLLKNNSLYEIFE